MSKKEEVFELPDKSDDAMDIPVEKVKAPRKKREMSDEAKEKMLANLAKGREIKKAKAELAKSAKEPKKVEEAPKVSGRTQISERSEANRKPKEEVKIDINAERERLSLINKIVGKEKAKPVAKRSEPALSETTKQTMKAERVKVVEEPKVAEKPLIGVGASPPQSATPKVSGRTQISERSEANPIAPPKPEVVHVVKRTFNKPIW
jgi:hypothetical protein